MALITIHHNFTPPKATILSNNKIRLSSMQCIKCHSPRIIRFLDGFGNWRVFCRTCQDSFLEVEYNRLRGIRRLPEFTDYHTVKIDLPR